MAEELTEAYGGGQSGSVGDHGEKDVHCDSGAEYESSGSEGVSVLCGFLLSPSRGVLLTAGDRGLGGDARLSQPTRHQANNLETPPFRPKHLQTTKPSSPNQLHVIFVPSSTPENPTRSTLTIALGTKICK